jgi:PAS domain S-box-containing protein
LRGLENSGKREGELCHTTRDGRRITVESRMQLVRESRRSFVIEANRDISERQAAERELARTQKRFETAFTLNPIGNLLFRLTDDVVVEANAAYAAMSGCSRSELIGKTLAEHDPLVDPGALIEVRRRVEQGLALADLEVQFRRIDGSIGSGLLHCALLEGAPEPHALVILQDITTRQRTEDELRLANIDLQQFAFIAAHDLQEPARNISTTLGLFLRRYRGALDADGAGLVQEGIDAAKRMHQMIRDVLAFARTATMKSQDAPLADGKGLETALKNLKGQIDDTGASITADVLPSVAVQPSHLAQIFQNLIGNAIKYRREGVSPQIHIRAGFDAPNWTFSIADNGIGFDPAFAEQIFGVFRRLHQSQEYQGNGIGLAICERIVRYYGGSIWATAAPDEGATFYFALPAASNAQASIKIKGTSV